MKSKTGKLQYQFKASMGLKKKNFVLTYNSFYSLLKCLYTAYRSKADNIFIFGDPSNYK